MKIKAILFDFDGTLCNTTPGILDTMTQTFIRLGIPVPDEETMKNTIGLPLWQGLGIAGKIKDQETLDLAMSTYRQLFHKYEVGGVTVFPQVPETLALLRDKGIRMAICTSRGAPSLDCILAAHGLQGYFETRVTNSDNLAPKPAPDMVLALLDRMGLSAGETAVVGDTIFDIGMGNGAGCTTCAVTYGNHSAGQLRTSSPDFIIDSFSQLPEVLGII